MPWQESSAASEQHRFIEAWLRGEETVAALCRRFGISRKTGYKRINRFKAWGYDGLGGPQPGAAHPSECDPGGRSPAGDRDEADTPDLGAEEGDRDARHRTAHGELARAEYGRRDPAARRGWSRHGATAVGPPAWQAPFSAATVANDVWCLDFKGWFRTTNGTRIDPLTVQDATSRYLLAGRGLTQPRGPEVRRRGWSGSCANMVSHGAIRTDNGPPFASLALGGLSGAGGCGGSSWASGPSALRPGTPSRTAGWNACTAR